MLNLLLKIAFSWVFLATSFSAVSEAPNWSKSFSGTTDRKLSAAKFVRISDGKLLYETNSSKLMVPASVTKLITSAAALVKFTPQHRFKTKFYFSGKRSGSTIHGDVYVVGDGDPYIVSEKLWQLAADLRHSGLSTINGNIVIDNQLFQGDGRDASRKFGKLASRNAYDAPVSAFAVNFNTIAVAIGPDALVGRKARAGLDPYELRNVTIEGAVTTTDAKEVVPQVRRTTDDKGRDTLTLSGKISIESGLQKIYRSVSDYKVTAGEQLRAFLEHEGIQITGQVKQGPLPEKSQYLFALESYDMAKIVAGLNKFSNNFIADVLMKRMGAAFADSANPDQPGSGSYENGLKVLRDFLVNDMEIKSQFVLKNGSGLDTSNRLSVDQIVQVLLKMEQRMDVFPEFLASLPASGWDGTLKKRFHLEKMDALGGKIRAKTGTLTEPVSVSSLAGYLRHPVHGLVAFAIIENGKDGQPQPSIVDLRDDQDMAIATFMNTN